MVSYSSYTTSACKYSYVSHSLRPRQTLCPPPRRDSMSRLFLRLHLRQRSHLLALRSRREAFRRGLLSLERAYTPIFTYVCGLKWTDFAGRLSNSAPLGRSTCSTTRTTFLCSFGRYTNSFAVYQGQSHPLQAMSAHMFSS